MKSVVLIRCTLLIAAVWLTLWSATAQSALPKSLYDSLWGIWSNEAEADTTRLKAMTRISWEGYVYSVPDSAIQYAQLQFNFAERKGLKKYMATALNTQGMAWSIKGDYAKALDHYNRSLIIKERIGNKHGIAATLDNIGILHYHQGDFVQAIDYYTRSLRIREEIDDERGMAASLDNIGIVYSRQADYAEALDHHARSLRLRERLGDKQGLAASLNNFGVIYEEQGDQTKALDYYARSLAIREAIGDKYGIASSLNNIGVIYKKQGNHTKAIDHFTRSLAVYEELGDRNSIALSLHNMGQIREKQEDMARAVILYSRSLAIREAIGDKLGIANSLCGLGSVYKERGDMAMAITFGTRALALAYEVGDVATVGSVADLLYACYKANGQPGKALEMYELRSSMRDSISSRDVTKRLEQMEFTKSMLKDSIAHAAAVAELESERRIATLQSEKARNRSWAFGIGGLLLLGGGGLVYRTDRRRRKERFDRDAALLQMKALRTQMNPHFIFNALNSINNYVQENERDLASGFLTKFARLMRLVLENSRHEEVPLVQDVEALRLYLDLEQARMNNRFEYEVQIDQAIDQDNTMVPPLVLQPFVENAIWHGLSRKDEVGLLRLSVRQVGGILVMTVEDNGVGREAATGQTDPKTPSKISMGTVITRERLEMLGKQRGGEAGFHYVEVPKGTCVEVRFPVAPAAIS